MKKPPVRELTLVGSTQITPNMQRLTFFSETLSQLANDCEGGYIKLMFNSEGGTDLTGLSNEQRPNMRTYTIRKFDQTTNTIEVDFVRHITDDQSCGFAARWAMQAEIGSRIHMGGPGPVSELNLEADWFFMVADMTALPALAAKVKSLPSNAKGYAVIKVIEKCDIQHFPSPAGLNIIWIEEHESLEANVRNLPWLEGKVAVWTACEFDSMRALRQYFRNEKEVERGNIYISSYWKQGVSEEGHKVIKQQDAIS
jgi:NADPH-dependent ferric siderophore reductase